MLKHRYPFKYGPKAAAVLAQAFQQPMQNSTLCFLCAMNLARIIDKLIVFTRTNRTPEVKLNFNQKEALAFHLAFTNKLIDTDNDLIIEIFTAIDRTL